MAKRIKSLADLESLYQKGENPLGFTAQTANGTAHWKGAGWNKDVPGAPMPEVEDGGPWQGKRSTRTGE